jgi:fumarylacetoacetate (FAA) hydrolase family protein
MDYQTGTFVGRLWIEGTGPILVHLRQGWLHDVTTRQAPTMRDLLDLPDPCAHLAALPDKPVAALDEVLAGRGPQMLSPADLQAIKACGVTFARSMIERVIEERAAGNPTRAAEIRARVADLLGTSLRDLRPGSVEAAGIKALLIEEKLWSQYLEVGIGPDAEVFTKCPPMASVGHGAAVGLHPVSQWNNPEPEVVLALNARGEILGASLGNDVNLRDVEGRSALLLGKAKDNNASAAIGPLLRLFDESFSLDDVRRLEISLVVTGEDGFRLEGRSSMAEISRDPADLAAQTLGRHHQYPDGAFLYCGTMFAPIQDRDGPGQGFTHHIGDEVTISAPGLGALSNRVMLATEAPEWTFGAGALMRNLAGRGLL